MIVSKITDGLGNQMFQYAFGLSLALLKKKELKLDLKWYEDIEGRFTKRKFLLEKLNIKINKATSHEINSIKQPVYPLILNSIYWRYQYLIPYYRRHHFKENLPFFFESNFIKLPSQCYVEGFFQSYKYFNQNRNILLDSFYPKQTSSQFNSLALELATENNSVSIHFRLGDYKITDKIHYCLEKNYYENAIKYITSHFNGTKFYIFSDEIEEVKKNFIIDNAVFVKSDSGNEIEDLFLMSFCKHNIIANSSFSWWAAWLNKNPHKQVICPENWFFENAFSTSDLIPAEWKKI